MGTAFRIDDDTYTHREMRDEHGDDSDVVAWCDTAQPGDVYDEMHSERVECIDAEAWEAAMERAAMGDDRSVAAVREASR